MNEIIKKIDKMIDILLDGPSNNATENIKDIAKIDVLQDLKKIILSEQPNPLTIGDKIRENNESLAEYIYKIQMIPQQPVGDSLEYVLNYLNQPTNGTE